MQTILIIDDTKINIEIIMNILGDNYDILVAINGNDALKLLKTQSVDLILLDIVMPNMDGYEVCEKIKENKKIKDIPVIFITAKTDEDSIEKAYDVGGSDYVTKPFKPKELIARVKNQLKLKHLKQKELDYNKQIALSELIHNIAHQWRQPLSTISTLSSGMCIQKKMKIIEDEEIINLCDKITQTTQYLSSTIETFKKFTNNSIDLSKFNLKLLIEENYNLLFGNTLNNDIEIEMQIDETIDLINYHNQLLQVLISIITNSKDALRDSNLTKKIILLNIYKNKEDNENVDISIYDNALGIDENIIKKVFEPYTTTRHKEQNKGLGLYIVHNIVTQTLNGTIDVENINFTTEDNIHKGTKFTITVPNL